MGFIQKLGKCAGVVVGGTIGGTVSLVGDILGSDMISDIGRGAYAVTAHTGEVIGSFGEGAYNCAKGIVKKDKEIIKAGAMEMADTAADYVMDMGRGLVQTTKLGVDGITAIYNGDVDSAIKVGKEFVKIGAISALSFSVLDAIDGSIDGHILDFDHDGVPDFMEKHGIIENHNTHHVRPHERHLADGRVIWVDGDGNSMVDSFGGWTQTNPNYRF